MSKTINLIVTLLVFFFATSFVANDVQAQGNKRISNRQKVGGKSGGKNMRSKSAGKSSRRGGRSQAHSKTYKTSRSRLKSSSQGVSKKAGITTPRETALQDHDVMQSDHFLALKSRAFVDGSDIGVTKDMRNNWNFTKEWPSASRNLFARDEFHRSATAVEKIENAKKPRYRDR